ncbi:hypothetical protein ACVIGB_000756 [Bradyrhizobium sp. USDA 4341]
MRIHFTNTIRPKLVARALQKAFAARGRPTKLMQCQEITAQLFGYPCWSDLLKLHASRAPSLDDADAPSQKSFRRQHYWEVLQKHVTDANAIGDILDEIKPTDRTSTTPDHLPKVLAEAFETDKDGKRIRSLGMQDLTWQVISIMCPHSWSKILPFPERPTVYSLSNGLSEAARICGMDGRLALPGLRQKVDDFLVAIGSSAALPLFRRRMDDVSQARWGLEGARKEERLVAHAAFSTDERAYTMFYSDHAEHEYRSELDDMFDGWGWDEYEKAHPRPPYAEREAYDTWNEAYTAWVAANAPPFVFATKPEPWGGLSAAEIRDWANDSDRAPDASELASSSLEEHYEDAYDDIVDIDQLCAIVDAWYPHADKGDEIDRGLEAKVAEWNKRQHICSYYPDHGTILPAFDGKTKDDAIAWCRANVEERLQRLIALSSWDPPVLESEAAPAAETLG